MQALLIAAALILVNTIYGFFKMNTKSFSFIQRFGIGLICCLGILLPTSHTFAVTVADVKYEGDVLPENNPNPFIRLTACDVRSLSAGTLNIVDSDQQEACTYYYRTDPLTPTDDVVLEFRLKVNSSDSSYPPPNRAVGVGFVDGSKMFQLGFSDTSMALLGLDGVIVPGTEVTMTTNVYHDYRIIKITGGNVAVYVDGSLMLSIPYSSLPVASRLNEQKVYFGAASGPGISNSEWDYFRYTISNAIVLPGTDAGYQSGYEAGLKTCEATSTKLAEQQTEIEKLKLQIQELQIKNQAAWTEGYQQGVEEGKQKCISDPASCQLYNAAQLEEKIAAEVKKTITEITSQLPRGILVSICKRTGSPLFCSAVDLDHAKKENHHHKRGKKHTHKVSFNADHRKED